MLPTLDLTPIQQATTPAALTAPAAANAAPRSVQALMVASINAVKLNEPGTSAPVLLAAADMPATAAPAPAPAAKPKAKHKKHKHAQKPAAVKPSAQPAAQPVPPPPPAPPLVGSPPPLPINPGPIPVPK